MTDGNFHRRNFIESTHNLKCIKTLGGERGGFCGCVGQLCQSDQLEVVRVAPQGWPNVGNTKQWNIHLHT